MKWAMSPRGRRFARGNSEYRTFRPHVEVLEGREVPAAFTPGNLVVLRVGTGSGTLSGAATAGFLEEYRLDGTPVQTGGSAIALPIVDGVRDQRITFTGNVIGEGALQRSADGQYLTFVGYGAAVGTANVASTPSATVNRILGVVGLDGRVDTTTTIEDAFSAVAVRSGVTDDGQRFWVSGGADGVRLINFGPNIDTTPILGNPASVQTLNIVRSGSGDQLFATSDQTNFQRMNLIGNAPNFTLPTTAASANALPGTDMVSMASNALLGFAFLDRDASTPGLDTLYVADRAVGIRKYFFDAGASVWRNTNATFSGGFDGFEGLVAVTNGPNAELYATSVRSAGDNNVLVRIVDNSAFNAQIPTNASSTTLTSAGANRAFRGVAFVPQEVASTAPRAVSITATDATPTNATQVEYLVQFSESVSTNDGSPNGAENVTAADFDLVSTTTGAAIASVTRLSSRVYRVTVNTGTGSGTIQLNLKDDGTIRDYGGNQLVGPGGVPNGAFTGPVYTIDKTPPQVQSITRMDASPTTASSIRYDVRFSEPVVDVDANDFQITALSGNLAISSTIDVTGSGDTYEVTVTTTSGTGTLRLDVVDDDSINDLVGNLLGGAGANNGEFTTGEVYEIDRSPPHVQAITLLDTNPTAANTLHFRVRFDEPVKNVDVTDFVFTATTAAPAVQLVTPVGAVGGFTDTYDVTTSSGAGSGTVRLDVADNDSIVDRVGFRLGGGSPNNGNFTSGEVYTIDHTPPAAQSIGLADPNPTSAAQVNFTVQFNDNVVGVDVTDFQVLQTGTLSTASVANVTPVSGNTYTVTVNVGFGAGTLGLKLVDNDTITDVAGNPLGGAGAGNGDLTGPTTYTVNREVPHVLAINRLDPAATPLTTVRYEVKFDRAVTGVNAGDFTLTGTGGLAGAVVGPVTGGGDTWTVTIDTSAGEGTVRLDLIDDDSITDGGGQTLGGTGAGNGNFTGPVYTVDRTTPSTVSITLTGAPAANSPTISYEVKFDQAVTGVDAGDFSLVVVAGTPTGAAISQVTGGGDTWTVVVDTGTGEGTVRLDLIDNGSITDPAGNLLGGAGAQNFTGPTFALDRSVPTVQSITRVAPNPTNAGSVQFTVTFSESVTGVDAGDFALTTDGTLAGVSITNVTGGGATYTVTVNTGTGTGSLRLDVVDNDTILDGINSLGGAGAGNGNFTTGEAYTIDRTPPAVQSIQLLDANPTAFGQVRFQVNFTEAVTGVNLTDFVLIAAGGIADGTLGTVTGSGASYVVTVNTGSGNGTVKIDVVDDDTILDVMNAPLGGAGAGNGDFTTGPTYTIDKTPPPPPPPPVVLPPFVPKALQDLLQRVPDPVLVAQWNSALAQSGSKVDVALGIMNTDEFRTLLVQRLAQRYLGRPVGGAQLQFLVGVLRRFGSLEATVIEMLARNGRSLQGSVRRVLSRSFRIGLITDIFQQYLRRNPTSAEANRMLAAMSTGRPLRRALYGDGLRNGVRHEQLIASLLALPEYAR